MMPRTVDEILAHADELAARFEDYRFQGEWPKIGIRFCCQAFGFLRRK